MGGVHAVWLATQGIVRAAGGTISTVFRSLIGTALGTISVLAPLFGAMELTPGMQIQAALGMISIMTALTALVEAQKKEMDISDSLRGTNMALHAVQTFVGVFDW